jgi:hypothetical protein
MTDDKIKIIRVNPKVNNAVQVFGLGRELKISPKSVVHRMAPGYKVEHHGESVCVSIGVGGKFTASLIMSYECWLEFSRGAELHITTMSEFVVKKAKKNGK